MTGYYDVLLVLIPVALVGVSGVLTVVGATLTTAVTLGGVVAAGLVAHGLFVNEPSTRELPNSSADSSYDPAD